MKPWRSFRSHRARHAKKSLGCACFFGPFYKMEMFPFNLSVFPANPVHAISQDEMPFLHGNILILFNLTSVGESWIIRNQERAVNMMDVNSLSEQMYCPTNFSRTCPPVPDLVWFSLVSSEHYWFTVWRHLARTHSLIVPCCRGTRRGQSRQKKVTTGVWCFPLQIFS